MSFACRLAAAAAVLLSTAALPAYADCNALDAKAREVIEKKDVAALPDLHKEILAEPSCDAAYREDVGRVFALLIYEKAATDAPNGVPAASELEPALSYGRPWPVLVALGSANAAAKNWGPAAIALEDALSDMEAKNRVPDAADEATVKGVARKALTARMLAPDAARPNRPRCRSTKADIESGGCALTPSFVAGIVAGGLPVPVHFASGSASLTPEAREAVGELAAVLAARKVTEIRLEGHADGSGNAKANLRLSKARALAVTIGLREAGYRGRILVDGKGAGSGFAPEEGVELSAAEKSALDRRVEVVVVR